GYKEVMAKKKYKPEQIVELIANPKPANWPGYPPMAPLNVPKDEAMKIAKWIVSLGKK
ncbi:MAG TPA: cytochrome C, partial [Runella sp.]|nr:cytochrome C [Runella sp.]